MADGAYGDRLGEFVGVEAPPTLGLQLFRKVPLAVTRVSWGERRESYDARIAREDAFLVCLQLRELQPHPYWVAGRPVPIGPIRSGHFSVLNLNVEHASLHRNPLDCLAAYIPRAALDLVAHEAGVPRIEAFRIAPGVAQDDGVVRSLLMSLVPALERPERANRLFLDSVGTALLTHLVSAYGGVPVRRKPVRGGLAPWQEQRAKGALRANMDGNITLDELAQLCGLSRSHFARAFARSTGLPPHRWLLARRVERAQELMLSTALPLEQIAGACGFADQSHFTRVFTAVVGVAPGLWRRWRRDAPAGDARADRPGRASPNERDRH